MEIERKFLIKDLPENLENYEHHELVQGYISTDPVIRIRRVDEEYILTVKSSGLLSRQEFELNLSKEQFQGLAQKTTGNIIAKTRYIIPIENGLKVELDIFHESFDGLKYAEVEFPSEEAAAAYQPETYFYKELTGNHEYQNSSLSSMHPSLIYEFIQDAYKN